MAVLSLRERDAGRELAFVIKTLGQVCIAQRKLLQKIRHNRQDISVVRVPLKGLDAMRLELIDKENNALMNRVNNAVDYKTLPLGSTVVQFEDIV